MLGSRSRLRFVIAIGLLLLLLLCGILFVHLVVWHIGAFVLGGLDQVRALGAPPTHKSDWLLFSISGIVALGVGSILALWGWYLLLVRTGFLRDDDFRHFETNDREDVLMTPPHGLGFTANVVWIVLGLVLAGGFALVGYHLANFPYEGWEGMQRYLRFPVILVPRYPFRVIPLLAMAIFGGFGAWLAEKIFKKLFMQK